MRGSRTSRPAGVIRVLVALGLLLPVLPVCAQSMGVKQTMRFAADMAGRGNWREAKYRWESVKQDQPDNPRLLNNLAVAAEVLGDLDEARQQYDRALALAGGDLRIEDNRRRFMRVLEERAEGKEDLAASRGSATDPALPVVPVMGRKGENKGKPLRVQVGIPVPPRLELESGLRLLVASFKTDDSTLLDVNREMVRFLRSEFRKETDLHVLDVVPPPAIPEQRIDDLIANREFWQHLSREYGADIIVSGVVVYGREDASSFQEVDMISPRTGQKVRQTRFVEQEEFEYAIDIIFMDGATGELLFRDRMRRAVLFRGQMNDPITAFYELSESISADVIAVVAPRKRFESRLIFRY